MLDKDKAHTLISTSHLVIAVQLLPDDPEAKQILMQLQGPGR
jgi:hypothetical protein